MAQSVNVKNLFYHPMEREFESQFLNVIAHDCSSALKEITITGFNFGGKILDGLEFDSALSKLEKLSFIGCRIQKDLNNLITSCVALKVLQLEGCTLDYHFPIWPTFKKLDELRLNNFMGSTKNDFINGVIASNPTVTKLSVLGCDFKSSADMLKIISTVAQTIPNLMELEISSFAEIKESIGHLSQLPFLEVLNVDLNQKFASSLNTIFTANATPIEHMKLMNGEINTRTIKAISRMEHLKVLELCNIVDLSNSRMVKLVKILGSKLEELKLQGSTAENFTTARLKEMLLFATKLSLLTLQSERININASDFQVMLDIVRTRRTKAKFLLVLIGKGGRVDVPDAIQEENRDRFHIDEKMAI